MRILCLHGMGTNGKILAVQTEMIRSMLPAEWEYVFVDGETLCKGAEGIREYFPGPYLQYYGEVEEAHNLIWDAIEAEGPFDGVLGFSQGAIIASSILLQLDQSEQPPFRFAIFFCSGQPLYLGGTITIPTVHVYGKQDVAFLEHSKKLAELCSTPRTVIEHDGGHEIPRSAKLAREVNTAVRKVVHSLELGH